MVTDLLNGGSEKFCGGGGGGGDIGDSLVKVMQEEVSVKEGKTTIIMIISSSAV